MARDYLLQFPNGLGASAQPFEVSFDWFENGFRNRATVPTYLIRASGTNPELTRGGHNIGEVLNNFRRAQLESFYAQLPLMGHRVTEGTSFGDDVLTLECGAGEVVSKLIFYLSSHAPEEIEPAIINHKIGGLGFVSFWNRTTGEVSPLQPIEMARQLFYPPRGVWHGAQIYARRTAALSALLLSEELPFFGIRWDDGANFSPWDFESYD